MSEILFVGKNDSITLPAMRLLSLAGYIVGVQPSFRCALAEILLHPPDLIVLFPLVSSAGNSNTIDRFFSVINTGSAPFDSSEFLAVLRSYYRLRSIPVVIVEDRGSVAQWKSEMDEFGLSIKTGPLLTDIAEAVEYGLTKPIDLDPSPRSSLFTAMSSRSSAS